MKFSPQLIVSLETEIKGILVSNWDRVVRNLMWDRLMKVRPTSGKREILVWLLESARIYPEGNGGNTRFDDLVSATTSFENENAGTGLILTKNEIEDNQLKDNPQIGVLDFARRWADDASKAAMYWPQSKLFALIAAGTTGVGYDGVPFFSASHPVNPNGGGGTYSNLITGVPINAAATTTEVDALVTAQRNFAKALAGVTKQRFFNGVPRYLRPSALIVPTALEYRARQLTTGGVLSQSTNVIPNYGLEVIVSPELDTEPDVYYLGVEDMMSNDLGPFVYSQREDFALRTYSLYDEASLNRRDDFEWTLKGRNTAIYGHPFLFYRCTP